MWLQGLLEEAGEDGEAMLAAAGAASPAQAQAELLQLR